MQRVQLKAKVAVDFPDIVKNVRSCLKRKLPNFFPTNEAHDKHVALVGSGPTVKEYVEDIRAFDGPVVALNAAHDFLLDHDIMPRLFVAVDPRARIVKGFQKLQEDVTYLIASQCHPAVFEHLKDHRVFVWHSYSDELHKYVDTNNDMPVMGLVHGGTTAGLRAIIIMYLMGFRHFHLYGMDSSFGADHIRNIDGIRPKKENVMTIKVNGRSFITDKQMLAQAMEITKVAVQAKGAKMKCYGDSLMAAIMEEARQYGREEFFAPSEDFHRVRPKTTLSLYGGGPFIDGKQLPSGSDHTVDDQSTPNLKEGPHGIYIQQIPSPVAL